MKNHEFEPDIDQAQWQAQERARINARDGASDADADDLRIARALRRAPGMELPFDFATRVAALARTQAATASLLEHRLLRGLSITFGLSSAATVAYYGRDWVLALTSALPGGADAVGWSAIAAVCVGANWAWGLLRQRLQSGQAGLV